jgi:hypothetical protein
VSYFCEKLVAGQGIFREQGETETFGVGNRYRVTVTDDVTMNTNVCVFVCVCSGEM